MQTKLQELTEKIYQEGINKASEESSKILAEAQQQADQMKEEARRKAEQIVNKARKESEELSRNSLNELQLSARQAISDLKQRVANLIEVNAITPEAKEALKDNSFVQEIIMNIIKNWNPDDPNNVDLVLLLPEQKQKEFEQYFSTKARNLLEKGLQIEYSGKIKGGFKIGPKKGGYLISFSDEDFDNFFRSYMRPRLIELLYGTEKK